MGLPAPDFTASSRWYDLKLFRAAKDGNAAKAISYDTQLIAIDAAFKAAGIVGSAKTHLARRSGAQMAELGGAEEGQVRRAGRWNSKVMESCYLSAVPREVLRVHAGFTREGGSYFLSRDVDVRDELLKKVFPWADEWDAAISTGKTTDGTRVEVNIAARGFISLLLRLRKVVIQDAVVLRKVFPKWFVWSHSLFSDPLFLQYERDLLASLDDPQPSDDRIAQVLPLLAEHLASSTAAMQQAMASGFVAVGAQVAAFAQQQTLVLAEQRKFHDAQMQTLHQHVNALSGMFMGALSSLSAPLATSTSTSSARGSTITSNSSSTNTNGSSSLLPLSSSAPSLTLPPPLILPLLSLLQQSPQQQYQIQQHQAQQHQALGTGGTEASAASGAVMAGVSAVGVEGGQGTEKEAMPAFEQDRSIASVVQLWVEWEYGLGGRSSVAQMDLRWGKKWRVKDAHRKHYDRRINIIAKIKSLAAERCTSCEVAAQLLESARTNGNGRQISLFQLNEQLKKGPTEYCSNSSGLVLIAILL
ncbi:hypothetical protein CF326_g9188 [Tilletia indica]|nr:hypothetical protein CF326_g9188 [Tilletia indica]